MKNYKRLYLLAIALVVACAPACKKKKDNNPGNVLIATVDYTHDGEIQHCRIVYDVYNNVDSIITTGAGSAAGHNGFTKFTYIGSSYTETDENSNTFTVEANTSGMILKILLPDTLSFIYNGSQLAEMNTKTVISTYPYYLLSSVDYTWTNGDAITMGNQSYVYDLSRSGQAGDALRINNFLSWGRSYIKTSHLPTLLLNTADTAEKYFYQFDNAGRISQLTKLQNLSGGTDYDTMVYAYSYY